MDMHSASDPFAVTSVEALEALHAQPSELVRRKAVHRIDPLTRGFIAASPFVLIGTNGARGIHITPRGDAAGFVEVVDETTLILPDRRGNNRLDALRDILEDNRVSLLFLVPGVGETLRVHGNARITTDPAMRARHAARRGKQHRQTVGHLDRHAQARRGAEAGIGRRHLGIRCGMLGPQLNDAGPVHLGHE